MLVRLITQWTQTMSLSHYSTLSIEVTDWVPTGTSYPQPCFLYSRVFPMNGETNDKNWEIFLFLMKSGNLIWCLHNFFFYHDKTKAITLSLDEATQRRKSPKRRHKNQRPTYSYIKESHKSSMLQAGVYTQRSCVDLCGPMFAASASVSP